MSELVHEFSLPVTDAQGREYTARIRGDTDENDHWEGWIEFLPRDGGEPLRTPRETTQSQHEHLRYWASGLSETYLQMALGRARSGEGAAPPPLEEVDYDPEGIHRPVDGSTVAEVVVETLDPSLPRRVMLRSELHAGGVRRLKGAGIVVYDGVEAEEGAPSRHRFLVQYGSRTGRPSSPTTCGAGSTKGARPSTWTGGACRCSRTTSARR